MAEIGFEGLGAPVSPDTIEPAEAPRGEQVKLLSDRGNVEVKSGLFFDDKIRRIDYILAYDPSDTSDKDWKQTREVKRNAFKEGLTERGVEVEEEHESVDTKTHFLKLHIPFEVCLRWAEDMGMQLPIEEVGNREEHGFLDRIISCCTSNNIFDPDIEPEPDQYTAPFLQSKLSKYLNYDQPEKFFTNSQRSRICYEIMSRTSYGDADPSKIGVERLLGNKSFLAAYPLHEGGYGEDDPENFRKTLVDVWGSWKAWYKFQPLDQVRTYFGEKIGIYFAWLGYYTAMLIPVSFLGFLCFIIGLGFINSSENRPAMEICAVEVSRITAVVAIYLLMPYGRLQVEGGRGKVGMGHV